MLNKLLGALIAITLAVAVQAHTSLKTSQPESGTILSSSPEYVTLEFVKPVRLTQLRVEAASAEERKLEFTPNEVSAEFTVTAPNLSPGRNAIHWTALSPDGHVIEGTIILVMRADE